MSAEQMRCLVTGATGYIGGRLVPRLLESGFTVRALARTPDKLARRAVARQGRGGPRRPQRRRRRWSAAFADVDVVYYLVHSMGTAEGLRRRGATRRARNVVDGRPDRGRAPHRLPERPAPRGRGAVAASVVAHEVGEILIASGIETIVLQAGVVIGSGSASFEMIRHLTDRLPVMTTPKWVHNKIQPIAIRDVLHYLVGGRDRRGAEVADVGHRRPRRPRVRRDDADLRRGRRSAPPAHAGAAVADPDASPAGGWAW